MNIEFVAIKENEYEKFISDLQYNFEIAVINEFGKQEKETIPRKDIEESINKKGAESFHIVVNNQIIGGVVLVINYETQHNSLDLLFIDHNFHSKGIGSLVWKEIEKKYPFTKVWETGTPYFEKRNIHFYINKCGFKIVEFFNPYHKDKNQKNNKDEYNNEIELDYFFRFEKDMTSL